MSTLAGSAGVTGFADGVGVAAYFFSPAGVAMDAAGLVAIVADRNNHLVRRIVISSATVSILVGLAGVSGSADGIGTNARLNLPQGVAIDVDGSVALVADTYNHIVRRIDMASGAMSTIAGTAGLPGFSDGAGTSATFNTVTGVSFVASRSIALVVRGSVKFLSPCYFSWP